MGNMTILSCRQSLGYSKHKLMALKPRGKPFDGSKPGPGRPKGSVNKAKLEFNRLLKDIADSEAYQVSLRERALKGDPNLDRAIFDRVLGPVKNITEINAPRPLVVDLLARDTDTD